jgi:uncharacterized protein
MSLPRPLRVVLALVVTSFVLVTAAMALNFPALTGRIVDDADVLDAATRSSLTETLAALETKTSDQLVVATVKSLQETSVEDYANQLFRRWQLGQKDRNNGVLLLVVPNERKVRIEVGYGLEGTLTDAISRLIIENQIIPRFRAGDFADGIRRGVDDIVTALAGGPPVWMLYAPSQNDATKVTDRIKLSAVVAFIVLWFALFIRMALKNYHKTHRIWTGWQRISSRSSSSHSGSSSSSSSSSDSFSGGGGSSGGGGASGSW